MDSDVPSLPIDADLVGAIFSSTDTLKFWIFNGTVWNESAGGGGITGINTNSSIIDHSTTLTDYISPASASATSEDGANVAANAIDESTANFWKSDPGINESITIDMGSVVNDFALAYYIDKVQTGITETQFQIKTLDSVAFDLTDLKAYYKMEASPVVNSSTDVGSVDAIASSSLTLTNATIVPGGLIDNGIAFDGTGDIARASGSAIADWAFINQNGAAFTIVYWVKMNNFTGTQDPLATTEHNASEVGIITRIGSTRTIGVTLGQQGLDLISFTTSVLFPNDTASFHMVMVQYDDATGIMSISVDDGTPETQGGGNLTNTANPTAVLSIGNNPTGAQDIDGDMDEVSIWDRILSTAEITALFNGGAGLALSTVDQSAQTLRTINVVDLVDQQYNFIRFNGVNAQQIVIEGSSGSSLVMAANDLQVLLQTDPPLITQHGQFTINGTNSSLALNGGDPVSSVIADPQVNSLTLNNVGTQNDPTLDASVMWQQNIDANNDTTRIKMKINGAIEEVRFF